MNLIDISFLSALFLVVIGVNYMESDSLRQRLDRLEKKLDQLLHKP